MRQPVTLEEFIAPISAALGHDVPAQSAPAIDTVSMTPAHTADGLSAADRVKRFEQEAENVRVHVHHCASADVAKTIADVVAQAGGGSVIAADDDRFAALGINDAVKDAAGVSAYTVWDASKGSETCVATAKDAAIGITFATAGIAETGTIVQTCSTKCGRSISLLPLTHIAVVDSSTIVASMLDVMRALHESGGDDGSDLPSQVCFISGPSNTSDIELVRVEGVHGPMVLHYVVYDA